MPGRSRAGIPEQFELAFQLLLSKQRDDVPVIRNSITDAERSFRNA
jgi:hypothetical protein